MKLFIPKRRWRPVAPIILETLALDQDDFILDILNLITKVSDEDSLLEAMKTYALEETDIIVDNDWLELYAHEVLTARDIAIPYIDKYLGSNCGNMEVFHVYNGDDAILGYMFTPIKKKSGKDHDSSTTAQ